MPEAAMGEGTVTILLIMTGALPVHALVGRDRSVTEWRGFVVGEYQK